MNILIANDGTKGAKSLAALFAGCRCNTEIINNPEDVQAYLKYRRYEAVFMGGACKNAFIETAEGKSPIFEIPEEYNSRQIFAQIAHAHGYAENHVLDVSGLKIDLAKNQLYIRYNNIHLTPQEYKLLRLLALHKNTLITKKMLLLTFYADTENEPNNPEKVIYDRALKLGYKIDVGGGDPSIIEAIEKQGLFFYDNSIEPDPTLKRGPIEIYDNNQNTYNGNYIERLNLQELLVLKLLMKNFNSIFSAEQILEHLHPNSSNSEKPKTIDVIIAKLRQKIAGASRSNYAFYGENVVQTVYGQGYGWQDPKPITPKATAQLHSQLSLAA